MSKLSVAKPQKFENAKDWFAYIVDENGNLTGVAGTGSTPEEAHQDALGKIEKGEGEYSKWVK